MAPDTIEGERKTVTALFADIKSSTELMESLDPEHARAIVDPALGIMVEAVRRYDGYIVQSTGDGIFALFGAPAAYEDHPQRALYAAVRMQQYLREYAQRLVSQGNPLLEARFGINTGEVVVRTVETGGKIEYGPIGHTTNVAARLQTLAPVGSIVVSEPTRRLVEGYFGLRALGPTRVRGIGAPINIYEVIGPGSLRTHFDLSVQRGLTIFVGRERELEQLKRAFDLTMTGHGQLVAVVAEAGTGKSRVFHEFKAMLPAECKMLEAYSVSHGKASAWLPVLKLLRGYFDIQDVDAPASRHEEVRTRIAALDPAISDVLPYLSALLGIQTSPDPIAQMDPQIRRQRTLDGIKRIVLRESVNQPTVVIFEDLHWIDSETQGLLDVLADSIVNARILLLVNYRPEYRHEWSGRSHYLQLRLDPLVGENAAAMLDALLGNCADLDSLKGLIAQRTGGNPFFMEEMVQALFDDGVLARNGNVTIARLLDQLRLPPTVQALLAARIDRLLPEQKDLLQSLAVIGREAPFALIAEVTSLPEHDRLRLLADLQRGEFIYEQPGSTPRYVFKHALTQQAAYESLLIERRKIIHERVGSSIESLFANHLDDHLTALAFHYSLSSNREKAIEYLGRAGQQAAQRSGHAEAIGYFNAALAVLLTHPDSPERKAREIRLQLALGPSLQVARGWAAPEVEHAYSRALELCEHEEGTPHLFSALFGLQALYAHRPKLQAARKLAERGLELAQAAQDPGLLLEAFHMLGYNLLYLGDFILAREYTEQGLARYHPEHHALAFLYGGDDPGVCCLCHRAVALWFLGYPDQALRSAHDALTLARQLSHPLSLALALIFTSVVHQLRRERPACQEAADKALTVSMEHGFPWFLAWGTILRGWALIELQHREGIDLTLEGLNAYQATGAGSLRSYQLSLIADEYLAAGQFDEGLVTVAKALKWAEEKDDRFCHAELHRIKGVLLLRQHTSNVQEAQGWLERGIDIARLQSAKSLELRAMTSLARLLRDTNRRGEAHTMLAEIYGWFTEGFDTADLKDAKAVLDERSA